MPFMFVFVIMFLCTELVTNYGVHDHGWNRECNSGCDRHCIRVDHVVFEGVLIMIVIVPSIQ